MNIIARPGVRTRLLRCCNPVPHPLRLEDYPN